MEAAITDGDSGLLAPDDAHASSDPVTSKETDAVMISGDHL
jgi:hypothetical protein